MDQRPGQLNEESWIDDRDDDVDTDTERIKADIEDTRAELGQTLNEIQERLSPEHLMGQVKETVREATIGKVEKVMETVNDKISNVTEPAMEAMGRAGEKLKETGSSLTNTVRRNPIPFALMGLGLGMFIVSRVRNADGGTTRSRGSEYGDEMGYGMATPRSRGMGRKYGDEYAGTSRQFGGGAIRQVKNTASGLMQGTTDTVSNLTHGAKEQALRAGRTFERLLHENPLAVSAAAVAVGAAVGLALPSTRMEKEYMGELSENVVDKTKQVAREAMDKVKSATQPSEPQPGRPEQPGQQAQAGQKQPQAGQQQGQAGQQDQQPRTGQSQAGQSQSGHGQPGQTMRPGGTPTA